MGGDEECNSKNARKEERITYKDIINEFYNQLLELGYLYCDLYNMTLKELENILINRRKGIAKQIYMLASLTRSPFVKNFPESPEEALPNMFPPKKKIPMPSFLMERLKKRGAL